MLLTKIFAVAALFTSGVLAASCGEKERQCLRLRCDLVLLGADMNRQNEILSAMVKADDAGQIAISRRKGIISQGWNIKPASENSDTGVYHDGPWTRVRILRAQVPNEVEHPKLVMDPPLPDHLIRLGGEWGIHGLAGVGVWVSKSCRARSHITER